MCHLIWIWNLVSQWMNRDWCLRMKMTQGTQVTGNWRNCTVHSLYPTLSGRLNKNNCIRKFCSVHGGTNFHETTKFNIILAFLLVFQDVPCLVWPHMKTPWNVFDSHIHTLLCDMFFTVQSLTNILPSFLFSDTSKWCSTLKVKYCWLHCMFVKQSLCMKTFKLRLSKLWSEAMFISTALSEAWTSIITPDKVCNLYSWEPMHTSHSLNSKSSIISSSSA